MKAIVLFLCAVTSIQRYYCLNLIDLPVVFEDNSNYANSDHQINKNAVMSADFRKSSKFNSREYLDGRKAGNKPQLHINEKKTLRNKMHSPRNNQQKSPLVTAMPYPPVRPTTQKFDIRRYFVVGTDGRLKAPNYRANEYEDEKDENLKVKISTLVEQTIHDTSRKIKSISSIKEKNRSLAPYKAGFILSMIKKSRDMLNELFNVAVKHKDEYKALEQLKIFEMIVHTNVDTTNLVRQLVEIHIQHLNATSPDKSETQKRRVVLL